jgi:hypothetical protein
MLHAKIMIINFMFHSMNRKNNKILIAFYPYMNIASSDIEWIIKTENCGLRKFHVVRSAL